MIEPIARLRFELQEIRPTVWRRVDIPLSSTLLAVHDIIQVCFAWRDAHLFEFRIGDKIYGEPSPNDAAFGQKVYQAKSLRLGTLIDRGAERFVYAYDFGDNWLLDIVVEQVRDGAADTDYPAFVDGARRAPPEDVGGVSGFTDFLDVVQDPNHEDHADLVGWYGGHFDPGTFDAARIRGILGMLANRRRGPLMSHRHRRRGKAPLKFDLLRVRASQPTPRRRPHR